MRLRTGIRRKIWTMFVLQVAAISFATVVGVYGAANVLENVLIKRALTGESDYYWQRVARDPTAQLPDTNNMTAYLLHPGGDPATLPAPIRDIGPGYHPLQREMNQQLVFVSDGPSGRLYLIFKQEQVGRLAFLFGFVPLIVVLLITYIATWLTYRASRRALSPVIGLANSVRGWDPKHPDLDALDPKRFASDPDGDVDILARALHGFATRIEDFVAREHSFTRDASHELRSPLTVIKVAAEVLLEEELSPFATRSIHRIKRACSDMEALMEALLILARESDTGLPDEDMNINDVVRDEIERAQPLIENRPVKLSLDEQGAFTLHAPSKVVGVMVGNLIRNACLYTEVGEICVQIGEGFVSVRDTGVGMSSDELAKAFQPYFRGGQNRSGGHGVGLTIVRRLSDRFSWPVDLVSEPGTGTTATIRFPGMQAIEPIRR
jgi:signal transduction histidine kinase